MNSTPDPTRDALYAAILAHPDEDTPRLVYADHIEEMGDSARAEFIRVQCRLATLNEWDDGYTATEVRCRRLLAEHPEWHRELGSGLPRGQACEPMFWRGFAEHREFSRDEFRADFESRFRTIPLRSTALRIRKPNETLIDDLAQCPGLARLRRLTLRMEGDEVGALAGVPHLAGLERLRIQVDEVRISRLKALAESPHLRNLRAFELRYFRHDGAFPEAKARWDWFPNLRELALEPHSSYEDYCARLFATGAWPHLERLSVQAEYDSSGKKVFEAIGDGLLDNLTDLALAHVQVRPTTLAPVRDLDRPRLHNLRLNGLRSGPTPATREQADELFQAPWLHDLRRLELPDAEVADIWLTSASDAPFARSLRALNLAGARFTPSGYRVALSSNCWWPSLQHLNLAAPQCPDDVLIGLIENPGMHSLVSLTAGRGGPAPQFLTRLAGSPAAARFRALDLSVKLDDATADALYRAPHLEHIDVLKVIKGTAGRTACNRLQRRFGRRITIQPNR